MKLVIQKFGVREGSLKHLGKTSGKIVERDGKKQLRINDGLFRATYIDNVPDDVRINAGMNKDIIHLFYRADGSIKPLVVELDPEKDIEIFKTDDKDVDYFAANEVRAALEAYGEFPTFWDKYGKLIASLTLLVLCVVFILVLNHSMGTTWLIGRQLSEQATAAIP